MWEGKSIAAARARLEYRGIGKRPSEVMIGRLATASLAAWLMAANPAGALRPDCCPNVEEGDAIVAADRPRAMLRVQAREPGGAWTTGRAIYPLTASGTVLRIRNVPGGAPRWYMIFPDLTRNYANANHPWMPGAYEWTGMDRIAYHRIELVDHRGEREIAPFDGSTDPWDEIFEWLRGRGADDRRLSMYRRDVGTFWFQAEVEAGGGLLRSHGIEDSTRHGISNRVARVSVTGRPGLLGQISSFHNVPGVFGSVLQQSRNHIGADCADLLMAAWSRWKRRALDRNHNVQMMVGRFPKRAEFEMSGGTPERPLAWGVDVFQGDFIAVRYGTEGRKYHHVGALWEDADGDGALGPADLVIHAGPDPLHLSRLEAGAFDGRVIVLKP
jgi:hypothetical protein